MVWSTAVLLGEWLRIWKGRLVTPSVVLHIANEKEKSKLRRRMSIILFSPGTVGFPLSPGTRVFSSVIEATEGISFFL